MYGYEFRIDFSDGTYDVLSIDANSIEDADRLLAKQDGETGRMLLCTIDRKPQVFLAW